MELNTKEIKRNIYSGKLLSKKENDLNNIITVIRRCGESYLLDFLFKNYLLQNVANEYYIIKLELDEEDGK